ASAMQLQFVFRRVILSTLLLSTPLAAQWVKYPAAGVPRKADGSVNMAAATPRLADGKPDFSGIWTTAEPNRPTQGLSSPSNQAAAGPAPIVDDKPGDPRAITASRQMSTIGVDLPGGSPSQPCRVPLVEERRGTT